MFISWINGFQNLIGGSGEGWKNDGKSGEGGWGNDGGWGGQGGWGGSVGYSGDAGHGHDG